MDIGLSAHSVHDADYCVAHLRMVVVEEGAVCTIGDDKADSQCIMSHNARKAIDGRGLHLEVGDLQAIPLERGEFFVEVG